jgi:histidyl-tRNA synthetase
MQTFGAKEGDYVIKINNRKLVNVMMAKYLGLDTVGATAMVKLLDKRDKMSDDDFRDQANAILEEDAKEGMERVDKLLSAKNMADLPEEIRSSAVVAEVQELFTLLERAGVKNAVFDITLMRGLDYYTGTVFEVFDTNPENSRAMFGGGRYDGLVGLFGAEPISAVGVAPGATTVRDFLETHQLLPEYASTTNAYVIPVGDTLRSAGKLAEDLRREGLNVELDITDRKIDRQIKTAVKKSIPYIIFVGEDEIKTGNYTIKNTISTEESKLGLPEIVKLIKK